MPKKTKKTKKQIYPRRALNTYATKLAAGPDQFKKRRAANPGKYLSEAELDAAFRPKKRKKKSPNR